METRGSARVFRKFTRKPGNLSPITRQQQINPVTRGRSEDNHANPNREKILLQRENAHGGGYYISVPENQFCAILVQCYKKKPVVYTLLHVFCSG